mmetsp:Transcript_23997/g.75118  ORF Transcript_23997/g.75118 Transcript_23997/m.75118 type:complete len:379 (+) Transcript_23997:2542-3678(+)
MILGLLHQARGGHHHQEAVLPPRRAHLSAVAALRALLHHAHSAGGEEGGVELRRPPEPAVEVLDHRVRGAHQDIVRHGVGARRRHRRCRVLGHDVDVNGDGAPEGGRGLIVAARRHGEGLGGGARGSEDDHLAAVHPFLQQRARDGDVAALLRVGVLRGVVRQDEGCAGGGGDLEGLRHPCRGVGEHPQERRGARVVHHVHVPAHVPAVGLPDCLAYGLEEAHGRAVAAVAVHLDGINLVVARGRRSVQHDLELRQALLAGPRGDGAEDPSRGGEGRRGDVVYGGALRHRRLSAPHRRPRRVVVKAPLDAHNCTGVVRLVDLKARHVHGLVDGNHNVLLAVVPRQGRPRPLVVPLLGVHVGRAQDGLGRGLPRVHKLR